MSIQKKSAADCIKGIVAELEQGSTDYAKQCAAHGVAAEGAERQFVVNDEASQAKITYAKESGGTRVELVGLQLDHATSIQALGEAFGKFKSLPPTPAGKWSAMVRYDVGNAAQTYAIIAEARQKIGDQSPITRITIRIDYED